MFTKIKPLPNQSLTQFFMGYFGFIDLFSYILYTGVIHSIHIFQYSLMTNSHCVDTHCESLCCNKYGYCPQQNYDPYYYDADYALCEYYYSDNVENSDNSDNTDSSYADPFSGNAWVIGLGLGIILIVLILVFAFVRRQQKVSQNMGLEGQQQQTIIVDDHNNQNGNARVPDYGNPHFVENKVGNILGNNKNRFVQNYGMNEGPIRNNQEDTNPYFNNRPY